MKIILGNIATIIYVLFCIPVFIFRIIGVSLDIITEEYCKLINEMPDSWFAWAFWRVK